MNTIRTLTFALLLCACGVTWAEGVVRGTDGTLGVLRDTPCDNAKVLSFIRPEYVSRFKTAALRWQGQNYQACWATPPGRNDVIILVDETGDVSAIPANAVAFDPEV